MNRRAFFSFPMLAAAARVVPAVTPPPVPPPVPVQPATGRRSIVGVAVQTVEAGQLVEIGTYGVWPVQAKPSR